ncbi:MAG: type II secretion system protein GspD [Thermoguttaceae bacterium]
MLEIKAKTKSGLFAAVVLGLTTTLGPSDLSFSFFGGIASAQEQPVMALPTGVVPSSIVPPPSQMPVSPQIAAQKLHLARRAVAARDYAAADQLAREVAAMNLVYQNGQERPEQIHQLMQQSRIMDEQRQTAGSSEQFRRNYALFSLQQADALLKYGDFELATQLTREAANQQANFNQAEIQAGLEPNAMFRRIEDVKRAMTVQVPPVAASQPAQYLSQATQHDLAQANSFLQQARGAFSAGDLQRAEILTRHASSKNLPESLFTGDSPSRLFAEISAKRQGMPVAQPAATNPVIGSVVQNTVQNVAANSGQNGVPESPAIGNAMYHPGQNQSQNVQVSDNGQILTAAAVDDVMRERQLFASQLSAEIMQQIAQADKICREQRNPDAALDLLSKARQRVEENPKIDQTTKLSCLRYIDRAMQDTAKFFEQYEPQLELNKQNQAVLADRRLEVENRRNKEEQLKTWISECNKLIDEGRYEEAVIVAKRARDFAPDEPATQLLLTSTQLASNITRSKNIQELKTDGVVKEFLAIDSASVIPDISERGIEYSNKWSVLTSRRQSTDALRQARRPESEREIIRKLEMPVSLNLGRPIPLEQLVRLLSAQTGVEIFLDYPALREVDVTSDTVVSIQLVKEIKLKSVLNLVLNQLGLSYVVEDEVLKVTSATKARGTLYQEVYYVSDLVMRAPNFTGGHPNDFNNALSRAMQQSVAQTRSGIQSGGYMAANGQMVAADGTTQGVAGNDALLAQNLGGFGGLGSGQTQTGQMPTGAGYGVPAAGGNQADFTELMDLIEMVVKPDSWEANGGTGTMSEYYPNLSLVINQTEEVHAEIVSLLNQLRKMNDLQIAVEVKYITLSDDFFEQMGIDFDMRFNNNGAAARLTTAIPADNNNNNNNNNNATNSQIVGGNNVTVGLTGADAMRNPSAFASGPRYGVELAQGSMGLVSPTFGGFDASAGIQMGVALLNDIETYFFLQAAQGDSRNNVLQAPKVMIFNGQMGTISDISQSPFVTSVIPVVGDFAAAYQPIIAILNEGQFMTVQGSVSSNRQYVRLTLNPTFSKITKVNTFKYFGEDSATEATETSSKGDDSATSILGEKSSKKTTARSTAGVTIQMPTLSSFNVGTTVSVPDGGTCLLGGIKRLSEGRKEMGVPILNKLPYISRLFSNTAIGRSTSSIVMVVTPRIVIQEEEEEYILGSRKTGI